uniref:Single Kunitz protease inhibitor n=1 Tax=Simulium nigrimanum TaxID=683695 RepID=D1FPT4_SIMNI
MMKTSIIAAIAILLVCIVNHSDAASADICKLPLDLGICRPTEWHFHYNVQKKKCEMFPWGCGGNANNFLTRQDCQAKCEN